MVAAGDGPDCTVCVFSLYRHRNDNGVKTMGKSAAMAVAAAAVTPAYIRTIVHAHVHASDPYARTYIPGRTQAPATVDGTGTHTHRHPHRRPSPHMRLFFYYPEHNAR